MSVVDQAWENARAVKERVAGPAVPGETLAGTVRRGERWFRGLFGAWGLGPADVDRTAGIQGEVAAVTAENLHGQLDHLDGASMIAAMHASGFSNGIALGLEIARLQLFAETDPRVLGGDIAGPGGPLDFGGVVIDASRAILADELDVARVDPERGARGQEMFAVLAAGRINQTPDRAKVMLLGDLDWLAGLITQAHGVAERVGKARELHALCQQRWNGMPHPQNGGAQR